MKIYTIKEIQEMVGVIIPLVRVKIEKLWEYKTGVGANGQWMMQNGEVSDETGKMKVVFSGREPVQFKQGDTIYIHSTSGSRGVNGVKVEQNEYQKKDGSQVSELVLKVAKTARLENAGSNPPSNVENRTKAESPGSPINDPKYLVGSTQHPPILNRAISEPGTKLAQYRALYELCLNNAEAINNGSEVDLSPSDVKDIASCMFIQGVKDGLLERVAIRTPNPEEELMKEDAPF